MTNIFDALPDHISKEDARERLHQFKNKFQIDTECDYRMWSIHEVIKNNKKYVEAGINNPAFAIRLDSKNNNNFHIAYFLIIDFTGQIWIFKYSLHSIKGDLIVKVNSIAEVIKAVDTPVEFNI